MTSTADAGGNELKPKALLIFSMFHVFLYNFRQFPGAPISCRFPGERTSKSTTATTTENTWRCRICPQTNYYLPAGNKGFLFYCDDLASHSLSLSQNFSRGPTSYLINLIKLKKKPLLLHAADCKLQPPLPDYRQIDEYLWLVTIMLCSNVSFIAFAPLSKQKRADKQTNWH